MKALILAAGRGSRLKENTDDKPKSLNLVNGRPIIEWIVQSLKEAGIDEISIVTGYKAEAFEHLGLNAIHNKDWESTNMVSSLLCAKDYVNSETIVSYSDIIYDSEAVHQLSTGKADFSVLYDTNWLQLWQKRFENPLSDAESFKRGPQGEILEIGKKVEQLSEIEGQYMGLLRLTAAAMEKLKNFLLPQDASSLDMTTLLNLLIQKGEFIQALPFNGLWTEIDTPSDLLVANEIFGAGKK